MLSEVAETPRDLLVILGPTASGKTGLGVMLARMLEGEIISADSRQVYRGLDIGSGKDLTEYEVDGKSIPYHLIDIVELSAEYSVFHYQQDCYAIINKLRNSQSLPILVGGTGLYLEAVLQGYRMVEAPENLSLRDAFSVLSIEELQNKLHEMHPKLHNSTDLLDRDRLIRALEIAYHAKWNPPPPAPDINPVILGIQWERAILRKRIALRLKDRLDEGLIEEVSQLHSMGFTWSRLELLGLEYRYVSLYLQGVINNRNDLYQKLFTAICQFAKRQETWFRRMERRGHTIYWLNGADLDTALERVREHTWVTPLIPT